MRSKDIAEIERRARQSGRGRDAHRPSQIPWRGWLDVLWRVYRQIGQDRVMLVAAGATYYFLLALFPALAAFVALYGLVADPLSVMDHIAFLQEITPAAAFELISAQLDALASQRSDAASFAFFGGLAVALWSVNNAIKALFEAMNIAYNEVEKRGILHLNLLSLSFALGAILFGLLLLVAVGVVPTVLAFVNLGGWSELLVSGLRWPLLLVAVALGITLTYRYGPSRERAKWRWLTWGASLSTPVWLAASFAFSYYLENFADYNATYGALGAVIGLMVWLWISVVILVVGAELNAELEHQTARDSTTGHPRPIGERGAVVADTIGEARKP